ncbi:MAG: hypothetical protein EP329_25570 [Deltaproteobacteria bacterium]|nr:MAG: hypothetical protein EP329_25570 [Deltaproteobacteria bacterium]
MHSNARTPLAATLSALALVGSLAACDSGPGTPPTGLQLHVYSSPLAANPYDGVAFIRLLMDGDGLVQPYSQVVAYAPGVQLSLDGVPFSKAGEKRQLVIEGWSANQVGQPAALVSRGRSTATEVLPGGVPQSFEVLFARVNQFQQLVSSADLSPQSLLESRVGHSVTQTPAGELVIAGGGTISVAGTEWWKGNGFAILRKSVEAIDTASLQIGSRSPMLVPRAWHTGTALGSGQVILAGGYGSGGEPIRDVELYNPPGVLDGTAKPLQPLSVARAGHTATLIDESTRVILFVGGDSAGTWELWDPVNGSQGVHALPDSLPRRHHAATTFYPVGRTEPGVLITGGESDGAVLSTAMLYDSVAQNMVPVGQPMPSGARTQHASVLVPARNFIYVAGGYTALNRSSATAGIDVFDTSSYGFIQGNEGFRMRTARGGLAATLGPNNTVVFAGGSGSEPAGAGIRPLASIEVVYEYLDALNGVLNIEVASSWNPEATAAVVPYMPTERVGLRAVALGDGMTLLVGGAATDGATGGYTMVQPLTLYNPL